jgi:PhnB protein
MTKVNVYLTFSGDCERAFTFYQSIFGGKFSEGGFNRYKDMPPSDFSIPDADKEKILHVGLPISEETALFGCDMLEAWGTKPVQGNNFSICVTPANENEAQRIFGALSADGKVIMPLAKQFWGSLNGMCLDKFGIQWMVDFYLG